MLIITCNNFILKVFSSNHVKFNWLRCLLFSKQIKPYLMTNEEAKRDCLQFQTNSLLSDQIFFNKLQGKIVFVDAANEDQEMVEQLKDSLGCNDKTIKLITLALQDNPTEMFDKLEKTISSCNVIIIFYNDAPLSWLTQRLRFYRAFQMKRGKSDLAIHIYSKKSQPKELRNLPSYIEWRQ